MKLSDNIKTIKGIGDKTALAFQKLNINNIGDLILYYPRNYLSYPSISPIDSIKSEERCCIFAKVGSYVETIKRGSLTISTFIVKDRTGSIKINWYNSPFIKNVFHRGDAFVFVGNIKIKNNNKCMEMPEYFKEDKYSKMLDVMQPVYTLTKGLTNNTFLKAIKSIESFVESINDYLPNEIVINNGLMSLSKALYTMHFPKNKEELIKASKRIAFDEFYKFLSEMSKIKKDNIAIVNTHIINNNCEIESFISQLPYKLTESQMEAYNDIINDMNSNNVMNRLLQGDVGSGKTIVAALSLFACYKSGYQGALMVPTEVLAYQHYKDLNELFQGFGIRIACLVGSISIKEKRDIYTKLQNNEIDILIGTHAIIEEKVIFNDLGLVITDEQHRFGVNQRKKLSNKGKMPHVLVMSATPIPRTLAIIMYADLDISIINELPKGRLPIKNCVVGTGYRNVAYKFIKDEVSKNNQVYVICPMVNESENLDVENVCDYTDSLREVLGNNIRIEYLHGQMKSNEKNDILQQFMKNEIQVIVSTTVIEVGINNPNATVMMIENSERFGLAQLHQLRGRVGRGNKQSYCIFINGKENEDSMKRLRVLEESNDGFYIAAEDLKLRGPGDFFGIRQSGDMIFEIADIYKHVDMLKLAQDIINKYGILSDNNNFDNIYPII